MGPEPVGCTHLLAHTQERKGSCLNKNSPGQVPSNLQFAKCFPQTFCLLILTPVLRERCCPFYVGGNCGQGGEGLYSRSQSDGTLGSETSSPRRRHVLGTRQLTGPSLLRVVGKAKGGTQVVPLRLSFKNA